MMLRPARDARWLEARNVGSSEVPPHGALEITGCTLETAGRLVLSVQQPTEDSLSPIAINSWKPIPANGRGLVTMDSPAVALYTGSTPSFGDTYGTTASSYALTNGNSGLVAVGTVDSSRDLLLAAMDVMGGGNLLAYTTTVIPGRSGTTAGGPVTVYGCYLSGTTITASGKTYSIYSWVKADSSDPADEDDGKLYIWIEQDIHGIWWFTGQDCPPAAELEE